MKKFYLNILFILVNVCLFGQSIISEEDSLLSSIENDSALIYGSSIYLVEIDAGVPLVDSLISNLNDSILIVNSTANQLFLNPSFRAYYKESISLSLVSELDSFGLIINADTIENEDMLFIQQSRLSPENLGELLKKKVFKNKSTKQSIPYELSPNSIDEAVVYKSTDSIVFDINSQNAVIFGEGQVDYGKIHLNSEQIIINWDSSHMTAVGQVDTLGKKYGEPIFKEGEQVVYAEKIVYNYETEKGDIYNLYTVQGEGYFQGEKVRKNPSNEMLLKNGRYTTCPCEKDEEPEFYLNMSKVKVIPDKLIIAGPTNLVLQGIPTPLFVPFGIFPLTKGRASGVIIPQYGNSNAFGYYLKGGGYYMGISDTWDIKAVADIYTKGKWLFNLSSRYDVKYKYNGALSLRYGVEPVGERYTPNYGKSSDFLLRWSHTKNKKVYPTIGFRSKVEFGTNNYHALNSIDNDNFLQNNMNSSINFSKNFTRRKWNLTTTLTHKQSKNSNNVSFSLPHVNFNANRFKLGQLSKTQSNKLWKKIEMRYSANYKNNMVIPDTVLFKKMMERGWITNTLDSTTLSDAVYFDTPIEWSQYMQSGFRHSLPIKMPFKSGYMNFNMSIPLRQIVYFESFERTWNPEDGVIIDTMNSGRVNHFYDGSVNLTANTRVYGMIQFRKNKFIHAIKHDIIPSLTATYRPDFGATQWGFYDQYHTYSVDSLGNHYDSVAVDYARFEGVFGRPMTGKSGSLRLNINNFIEAKFVNRDTTAKKPYRKVKIVDQFNVTGSYNFIVDTLNMSKISTRLRSNLFKNKLTINFNATHDPYVSDSSNRRINQWEQSVNGRLARMTDATLSLGTRISEKGLSERKSQWLGSLTTAQWDMYDDIVIDYIDFSSPWSMNFGYNLKWQRRYFTQSGTGEIVDSVKLTNALDMSYTLKLTPKWSFNGRTSYDFKEREIGYTTVNIARKMDCWFLTVAWVPFGPRRKYEIVFRANSDLLKDLKYDRKKNHFDYANFE